MYSVLNCHGSTRLSLVMQRVSKRALQRYSKCYCVASVTKRLACTPLGWTVQKESQQQAMDQWLTPSVTIISLSENISPTRNLSQQWTKKMFFRRGTYLSTGGGIHSLIPVFKETGLMWGRRRRWVRISTPIPTEAFLVFSCPSMQTPLQ
jgi:hypothetical protein